MDGRADCCDIEPSGRSRLQLRLGVVRSPSGSDVAARFGGEAARTTKARCPGHLTVNRCRSRDVDLLVLASWSC